VQAILEDEEALVQRIFVVEHLRAILLAHAEAIGAPEAVRVRFADVTCQPSYPHDDHLHVRLFCTDEDLGAGCADGPPMYPWRRAQLRAAGIAPVFAPRARRGDSPPAEAREEPPMHERVRAFLDLRRSWESAPHPGRPYCR
jgi:penicillin-insensitive murein endopeptidase